MPINNPWTFSLRGPLPVLSSTASDGHLGWDMNIWNEEDHINDTLSEDFLFDTWYCNGVTDPDHAFAVARELVELHNGVYALLRGRPSEIELQDIYENNRHVYVERYKVPIIRLRETNLAVSQVALDENRSLCSSNATRLLNATFRDDEVFWIVKAFSGEPDFRDLSTTMELVKEFANTNGVSLAIDAALSNRFFATANNFQTLGFGARHGHSRFTPPSNPLPYEEGYAFVQSVCRTYLRTKGY